VTGLARRHPVVLRSVAVFAVTAVVLGATMTRNANVFDEGIILGGAMRVLAGEVTHVDFYSCYGPAAYWAVALLFKLTGPSFLAARLLGVATAAGCVALGHGLAARIARPSIALGSAALMALWFMGVGSFLYPVYPCILLALAGGLLLTRTGGAERAGTLVGSGACAGLAALFRYDAGFFIMAGLVAAAVIALVRADLDGRRLAAVARAVVLVGLGVGIVFLPPAIAYLAPHPALAFAAFKADIIDYPLQWYGPMRRLPWPGPAALAASPFEASVYLGPLLTLLAIPAIRGELRELRVRSGKAAVPVCLMLAVLVAALFYKGTVRVSPLHTLMATAPALVLVAAMLERWTAAGGTARRQALGVTAALLLIGLFGLRDGLRQFRYDPGGAAWLWAAREGGVAPGGAAQVSDLCPTWRGMRGALLAPHYALVSYYLSRHTAAQDRVLVGLAETDRVFVNPLLINYAANRLPGTHWSQYDPGLQNRADIQRQMVAELQAGDVRWVVRDTSFDDYIEPNRSSWHSGVRLLDDFVEARYRPVAEAGAVSIWLRRDVTAPDTTGDPPACRMPAS